MIPGLTLNVPIFLQLIISVLLIFLAGLFAVWLGIRHKKGGEDTEKALGVSMWAMLALVVVLAVVAAAWPAGTAVKTAGDTSLTGPTTSPPTSTPPTEPPPTEPPPTEPPTTDPPPTPPSAPERFEVIVDTPTLMKAGGNRVGTNRFQLEDYANDGLLVQVAPAWTAYDADGTEFRDDSCSIVVKVEGPESFGPWYSKRCTKSDIWNGNGDPADGGTSEISLPGIYTVTLEDENTGVSTSLDFEVIE